jgi:hypothetical protein
MAGNENFHGGYKTTKIVNQEILWRILHQCVSTEYRHRGDGQCITQVRFQAITAISKSTTVTERRVRVGNNPASFSRGLGFKSRHNDRLS